MIRNLRELRLLKGLTQTQLAEQVGYTQKVISNWETLNVEPNCETLCKLSKIFEVSVDYLVGNTEEGEETAGSLVLAPHDALLLRDFHALTDEQKDVVFATIKTLKK